VEGEGLAVSKMASAVKAAAKKADEGSDIELWVLASDKSSDTPRYRFRPVVLDPGAMTTTQKSHVVEDLRAIIEALAG